MTTDPVLLRRSAAGAAILLDLGIERGVAAEQLLRNTGLTEHGLRHTEAEIEPGQEIALTRNLLALCEDPGFGLIAGSRYHATTFGTWGLVLANSATGRDALRRLVQYSGLTHSFCRMRLEEDPHEIRFYLDADQQPGELRALFTERTAAAAFTAARALSIQAHLTRFHFAYPAPPHAARYSAIFGIPVEFDADHTFAGLDPELLDQPITQADEHTARWYDQQARQLLSHRHGEVSPGIAARVRQFLYTQPGRMPIAAEAAEQLGLSVRTLGRRLAEENTSYRRLQAEIRRQLAEELLTAGRTVEQTAHSLGYAEPAAFQHAFQRWNSITPGKFARRHRYPPANAAEQR